MQDMLSPDALFSCVALLDAAGLDAAEIGALPWLPGAGALLAQEGALLGRAKAAIGGTGERPLLSPFAWVEPAQGAPEADFYLRAQPLSLADSYLFPQDGPGDGPLMAGFRRALPGIRDAGQLLALMEHWLGTAPGPGGLACYDYARLSAALAFSSACAAARPASRPPSS